MHHFSLSTLYDDLTFLGRVHPSSAAAPVWGNFRKLPSHTQIWWVGGQKALTSVVCVVFISHLMP